MVDRTDPLVFDTSESSKVRGAVAGRSLRRAARSLGCAACASARASHVETTSAEKRCLKDEIASLEEQLLEREQSAPHTAAAVTGTTWDRAYSREQAAFPASWVTDFKFPVLLDLDDLIDFFGTGIASEKGH